MPFDDIIGQAAAKQHLRAFLAAGRVPNALLFTGPWGAGKTRTALVFARALNCQQQSGDACDACRDCRKALRFVHPDIRFVFPMPRSQKKSEGARAEEEEQWEADALHAMAADPFHIIQFERNASIWIEKTRELRRATAMSCAEGRCKVFILREADRMRDDQANSILKILEEPPADTHFILTTARPQSLLPTIVSRCQRIEFAPLAGETIARLLVEQREVPEPDARLCAALAQGSLGRALLMAKEDVRQVRDTGLAILEAAARGGPHLHAVADSIARTKDRNLIRRIARALALWHGDLLAVRCGVGEERLVNIDRRGDLERQAAALETREIERRLELCEELSTAMDRNAGFQVAIYWLLASLADPAAAAATLLAEG